jgi:glycogen phosphorylase/synthase
MEIFEVSWEVCHKVGGIYTVISSKAEIIKSFCKEHYYIGPYLGHKQNHFIEKPVPKKFQKTFQLMREQGIECHYGTWKTNGTPNAILIDFFNFVNLKNEIKTKLWEKYQIDSLFSGWEFEEPVIFSYAVAKFLEIYSKRKKDIIGHFHEWMAGLALLLIPPESKIKTIFTTHATMLGRTMSGNGKDLETEITKINPDEEAKKYNVQDKHMTEKACALNSTIFTTVSDITAKETDVFFGRKPDFILYNGLDGKALVNYKKTHKVEDLLKNIFGHHYEIKNPFVIFTSGRFEFHGKGIDIFIESLKELNFKLKGSDKTVVALILTPMENWGVKKEYYEEDKGLPLNCTHYVRDTDLVVNNLNKNGLNNSFENNVKVIYIPIYITPYDGFFNCHYYELTACCDLGIFPSKYEPWGYTPLECISLGIPTITTTSTGFGQYISKFLNYDENDGVYVLKKRDPILISELIYKCVNKKNRDLNKISAKALSARADWRLMIKNYHNAYNKAIDNSYDN